MEELKITFKRKNYLLIGDLNTGGAIATKEQYENFEESYAHLYPDGNVSRYGESIGNVKDIKVVGKEQATQSIDGMIKNNFGYDWPGVKRKLKECK